MAKKMPGTKLGTEATTQFPQVDGRSPVTWAIVTDCHTLHCQKLEAIAEAWNQVLAFQ